MIKSMEGQYAGYEPLSQAEMLKRVDELERKIELAFLVGHSTLEEAIDAMSQYHHDRCKFYAVFLGGRN
ncbi:MAG: hypothetical protein AUI16_02310 [Alphaproteobacteria bacterium 13_2_20CM_2_64_7]|nr:MAG: hypothetical protein AUI16_02310 [Alphaproteobacteria bacterium 13_2_20CM_2_64_7]